MHDCAVGSFQGVNGPCAGVVDNGPDLWTTCWRGERPTGSGWQAYYIPSGACEAGSYSIHQQSNGLGKGQCFRNGRSANGYKHVCGTAGHCKDAASEQPTFEASASECRAYCDANDATKLNGGTVCYAYESARYQENPWSCTLWKDKPNNDVDYVWGENSNPDIQWTCYVKQTPSTTITTTTTTTASSPVFARTAEVYCQDWASRIGADSSLRYDSLFACHSACEADTACTACNYLCGSTQPYYLMIKGAACTE